MIIDDIQIIHTELTNKCNARCPGCSRTQNGDTHPYLKKQLMEWSIDDFKKIFPKNIVKNKSFTLGGVVDEPMMVKDIVSICEYIVANHGEIEINTNTGSNKAEIFAQIGKLSEQSNAIKMIFSVDGCENTNHLYRVNVQWNKVLENMTAYVEQGGVCEWHYLIFQHNKSDIENAKLISKKLKIPLYFRQNTRNIKDWQSSVKTKLKDQTVVVNQTISTDEDFKHPEHDKVKNWKHKDVDTEMANTINCLMLHKKEIFIDWSGKLWPCCWFSTDYHFDELPWIKELEKDYGVNWNNVHVNSIEQILQHDYYNFLLQKSWIYGQPYHANECFKQCGDFAKRQNYLYSTLE